MELIRNVDEIIDIIAPLGEVKKMSMFNCWGIFVDNKIVAFFKKGEFFLKAKTNCEKILLTDIGSTFLSYNQKGRTTKVGYYKYPVSRCNKDSLLNDITLITLTKPENDSNSFTGVANIDITMRKMLRKVKVKTPSELRELGAYEVYSRIRAQYPGTTNRTLRCLIGAIDGVHWAVVPPNLK